MRAVLSGEKGAYRDSVLFNGAAALNVAGKASDWAEGTAMIAEAIDSGRAMDKTTALATLTSAAE